MKALNGAPNGRSHIHVHINPPITELRMYAICGQKAKSVWILYRSLKLYEHTSATLLLQSETDSRTFSYSITLMNQQLFCHSTTYRATNNCYERVLFSESETHSFDLSYFPKQMNLLRQLFLVNQQHNAESVIWFPNEWLLWTVSYMWIKNKQSKQCSLIPKWMILMSQIFLVNQQHTTQKV